MFEGIDFAINPEPRCPVILVLDVSASMLGEPIDLLNQGLKDYLDAIQKDDKARKSVETCVITFSRETKIIHDFKSVDQLVFEKLYTESNTNMYPAITTAISLLEKRKAEYKSNKVAYYRPWLILITDGESSSDSKDEAEEVLQSYEKNNKLTSYILGVGDEVNFEKLKTLKKEGDAKNIKKISEIEFTEVFNWLSASVRQVSQQGANLQESEDSMDFGESVD